jgi:hypothetical protein
LKLRLIGPDSCVPGEARGELDEAQLEKLASEPDEPDPDGSWLVIRHPPIWSTTPVSSRWRSVDRRGWLS